MRMDITGLIDDLSQDLSRAAEVGGEEVRAAAERLLLALDPALRLTLMDALSQAAAEIREALPGVAIDVRLIGREPVFVVEAPRAAPAMEETAFEPDDGEPAARITLRLPEALKSRAEALAARRGQSLNTWLVAAARAAAAPSDGPQPASGQNRHHGPGRRVQGWAR
jgi:hypothetical protein